MPSTIDVMMPYYGPVDLMKESVRSVLRQTFEDFRLVVIDDGFPDPEPQRWFDDLADPRVVYLRNSANLGANGNYRKAVTLVESEWFVMMGADDVMHSDYLAAIVEAAARDERVDIIQPGVAVIDENGTHTSPLADRVKRALMPKIPATGVVGGEALAASLLRANWAYFPALAWRTATVQGIGFREDLDVAQDLALILDIVTAGGTMAVLPDVLFDYRRHSASDSSVRALDGRRFDEERRFFRSEAARFATVGWPKAAKAASRHVTSRLNAATLIPRAARANGSVRSLLTHVFR